MHQHKVLPQGKVTGMALSEAQSTLVSRIWRLEVGYSQKAPAAALKFSIEAD
jgi:hypothetical protein